MKIAQDRNKKPKDANLEIENDDTKMIFILIKNLQIYFRMNDYGFFEENTIYYNVIVNLFVQNNLDR